MSEVTKVTSMLDRLGANNTNRVAIGSTALEVAIRHIREQKAVANIAEEWVIEAGWRDEEEQLTAALAGYGLRKTVPTE